VYRRIIGFLLKRGLQTALDTTAAAASQATSESFRQIFNVQLPCTVYVRAAHCTVDVRRQAAERERERVELHATLRAAFGWEFSTDQDDAGVYIVAKRKPVVGALADARFSLNVPTGAHLVLHLTPGSVHLIDFDGKITLEGASMNEAARLDQDSAIITRSAQASLTAGKAQRALRPASTPLLPEGARSRPARRASAQER
jgi:hypothetical protein